MRTWTKVAVVAVAAAALVAGAGAAVALSSQGSRGSGTVSATPAPTATSPSPSPTGDAKRAGKEKARGHGEAALAKRLLRTEHATWVTKDAAGSFTTHQVVRGTVTAVSATSVTVKAADGFELTYSVGDRTVVRQRPETGKGAGTASSISAVKAGVTVAVSGVGAKDPTARLVLTGVSTG